MKQTLQVFPSLNVDKANDKKERQDSVKRKVKLINEKFSHKEYFSKLAEDPHPIVPKMEESKAARKRRSRNDRVLSENFGFSHGEYDDKDVSDVKRALNYEEKDYFRTIKNLKPKFLKSSFKAGVVKKAYIQSKQLFM